VRNCRRLVCCQRLTRGATHDHTVERGRAPVAIPCDDTSRGQNPIGSVVGIHPREHPAPDCRRAVGPHDVCHLSGDNGQVVLTKTRPVVLAQNGPLFAARLGHDGVGEPPSSGILPLLSRRRERGWMPGKTKVTMGIREMLRRIQHGQSSRSIAKDLRMNWRTVVITGTSFMCLCPSKRGPV